MMTNDNGTPLAVDVFRHKNKLIILAPIAGITIEDINVAISDDILTIKGERKLEEDVSNQNYFSREVSWGKFSRSIVLPISVNIDKVAAFYKKGILRIELPIIEDDRSRVIPIIMDEE